jgi:hypothetical protein
MGIFLEKDMQKSEDWDNNIKLHLTENSGCEIYYDEI